jgi:low affinity Fe/Cu permease
MAKKSKEQLEEFAFRVTRFVGSVESIVIHSLLFLGSFVAVWTGLVSFDRMLLVLTTLVSLEAIYLSIFIQMTINYQAQDIDEIQEDIDEIQEDVDEIQEDVDEIQEDVEELDEQLLKKKSPDNV